MVDSDSQRRLQRQHLSVVDSEVDDVVRIEKPTARLVDMVGQATTKRRLVHLTELLANLEPNADQNWTEGTLFYGPARTGKHFSAEVIAGERQAPLIRIDMTQLTSRGFTETVEKVLNETHTPRIVSLEDIEVTGIGSDQVNEAVANLIGLIDKGVAAVPTLVIATAELPWLASKDLVQPGRLGEVLLILPPDAPARAKYLLAVCGVDEDDVDATELDWVVRRTDGFSFGELSDFVALCREFEDTDEGFPRHETLRAARVESRPQTSDWLSRAGNHAFAGDVDGLYDDLLNFLRSRERH